MPTGYTSIIEERDDVTFQEFAMRCAREMMPCISLREEPLDAHIPAKLVPSAYYADRVSELEKKIETLLNTDLDSAQQMLNRTHESAVEWTQKYNISVARKRAKLAAMREETAAWVPPTNDHENLKKFMLDQLDQELALCGDLVAPEKPKLGTYLEQQLQDARERLESAKKDLAAEEERFAWNNRWIDDLRKNLGVSA
jgi:hypothetical protein